MPASASRVEGGHACPAGQQLVEALELGEPERAGEVAQAVVESEPVVVEPAHVGRAALVALGVDPLLDPRVRAHHRPALAGGDLLVRVEAEHREVPARAHGRAVRVEGAQRLAAVLHQPQAALGGQALERRQVGRVAEDVHRQQPGRALADRRGRGRRVDVERARVDVAEDGPCPLVEQAVGRGDEREGRGHDLVARLDPRRPHGQVQPRRAARDRRHRPVAESPRERVLEGWKPGPERAGGPSAAFRGPGASSEGPMLGRASGITAATERTLRARPSRALAHGRRPLARAACGRAASRPRASPRAPPSSPR